MNSDDIKNKKLKLAKSVPHPLGTNLLPGHQLVTAFEWNGRYYWKFAAEINIPFERMQVAMGILQEFDMKVDKNFLLATCAIIENNINTPTPDYLAVVNAVIQLKQRLSWPFDADMVYKLAAVTFFDDSENPYGYDAEYAEKKIKAWRSADADAELLRSFFLNLGLEDYVGALSSANIVFLDYLKSLRLLKKEQLSWICGQLSGMPKMKDLKGFMLRELTTLSKSMNSADTDTATTSSSENPSKPT